MKRITLVICVLTAFLQAQENYDITVEGARIPLMFDSRRDVIVIEGKALRKFPALNLAQLLSFAANMNFVNKGLFVADPQILGFNQEQVVVMIHGIPVNNSQTGHHNFVLPIDPAQIERIEILRGGFSSLFGSSGCAGVINIVPSGGKSVAASLGSFGTCSGSLNLGAGRSYLSSGIQTSNGYMRGLDGRRVYVQGGTRIERSRNLIDVWGGWVRSKFGATNFYAPYPSFEDIDRLLGILKWKRALSRNLSIVLNASSQLSHDRYRLYRDDPGFYSNRHQTFQNSLELGLNAYLKNLSLAGGASGFFDMIDSSGMRKGKEASALGRHRRSLYALFGEMSGGTKKVLIDTGFRWTAGDFDNLSGHLFAGFTPWKGLKLETSVFRSFRIPTYTELYYEDPAHLANPRLSPEITWGLSLGLKSTPQKNPFGVRFFKHWTQDMIDWEWIPGKNLWVSKNIHSGLVTGIDLEYSAILKKSTVRALYTWQTADFSESFRAQLLKYHFYFPEHSLSLFWTADLKQLSLATALKVERAKGARRNRYYLNIKAERDFRRLSVFVETLNLFNNRIEKTPGLQEWPRTFDAGISLGF